MTGREAEPGEHRLDRAGRLPAHAQQLVLGDRLDPGVHLPVALGGQPLLEVVRVVVAAAEGVVLARHHRVAGGDEVGAGQELAHQLRRLADLRVRRDRVVARRDLEVEPGREHVLGEDLADAAGHREHERHARDRPVLDALRAGGADRGEAAGLEVEHRVALRVAHQRLGAAAGGEAHLHAPRRVRGGEKRLRPGRVVTVHEHGLGAVHRQRLRIGDEPLDRELEVAALLDRALRHHARPAGLRADQDRDRVQRRVAGDADRGLHLGEAARRRLGGVGGEQRRVLLQVRDVRLVGRGPPRAQLLEREHQLDGVEPGDHAREPRGRQPAREPDEVRTRDVHVDEPARDLVVRELGGLRRDLEVEAVERDEAVDHVEVLGPPSVHRDDAPAVDLEPRLRVVRAVHRDEPELRVRRDQQLAPELPRLAGGEPLRPALGHRCPAARARHTRPARRGRRPPRQAEPSSVSNRSAHASSSSAVERCGRRAV